MSFEVAADSDNRFMGRYSGPLATRFADWSGVPAAPAGTAASGASGAGRALDVGCGTGALTRVLIERLGVDGVSAVDPSQPLLTALRQSFPTLDAQTASAEQLPYPDDLFDHVLAQLVVSFMSDPVLGLREMARVARPGGTVSACVWDLAGGGAPLAAFWRAARDLDPGVDDESGRLGVREGELADLCDRAGLNQIEDTALTVTVRHPSFEDWWEPYTLGAGPAGAHVASLDEMSRVRLRDHCRELLPEPPFYVMATAWAVRARA